MINLPHGPRQKAGNLNKESGHSGCPATLGWAQRERLGSTRAIEPGMKGIPGLLHIAVRRERSVIAKERTMSRSAKSGGTPPGVGPNPS